MKGFDLYLLRINYILFTRRMTHMIEWLEQYQLPCVYRQLLGIPCPACGLQRSFIELLKGHILESFRVYPPLLPILVLFIFTGLHLMFKYRKGASILRTIAIITGALMVCNYIITIILSH